MKRFFNAIMSTNKFSHRYIESTSLKGSNTPLNMAERAIPVLCPNTIVLIQS